MASSTDDGSNSVNLGSEGQVPEQDRIIGVYDQDVLYVDVSSDQDVTEIGHFNHQRLTNPLPTSFSHMVVSNKPQHLDPTSHTLYVIISSLSGKQQAETAYNNLLKPLLKHFHLEEGTDFQVTRTTSADSVSHFTYSTILPRARASKAQTIILLAGDGGILDIVNSILSADKASSQTTNAEKYMPPVISILPFGTGNALANSSNILSDKTFGLSSLLRGTPAPLPLFSVHFDPPATIYRLSSSPNTDTLSSNDTEKTENDNHSKPKSISTAHGAVVLSWCLHASLVADSDTPEYRKHGSSRFQIAANENLFPSDGSQAHAYRGALEFKRRKESEAHHKSEGYDVNNDDDEVVSISRSEHAYIILTMCSQLEAGFRISPHSKPLDGHLRLVHFGPFVGDQANNRERIGNGGGGGGGGGEEESTGTRVMKVMQAAYQGGSHLDIQGVGYEDVEWARIVVHEEEERYRRICVDGSIYVVPRGGSVTVSQGPENVVKLLCLSQL